MDKSKSITSMINVKDLARALAREANEQNFSSHRGVFRFTDASIVCYYNNHPYTAASPADPMRGRGEELTRLRAWLAEQEIEEVAFAAYPSEGEDAGYSFALLVTGGETVEQRLLEQLPATLRDPREKQAAA